MALVTKNLFRSRAESYFGSDVTSTGAFRIFARLYENTVGLFDYFKLWLDNAVFPVYSSWKATARQKVRENKTKHGPTFV